jgi:hypothetical protein
MSLEGRGLCEAGPSEQKTGARSYDWRGLPYYFGVIGQAYLRINGNLFKYAWVLNQEPKHASHTPAK